MRKTFALHIEGRHPDRVLDGVKHEIRKYFRRERRRALPEGADFWDFDCRIGAEADSAAPVHPAELIGALDIQARSGAPAVYVEVRTRAARRTARPAPILTNEDRGTADR